MIDRRTAMIRIAASSSLGLGIMPGRSRKPPDLPLGQWLESNLADLPHMAGVLANWEVIATKQARPTDWSRYRFVDAIKWRPGVSLAFGVAPRDIAAHLRRRYPRLFGWRAKLTELAARPMDAKTPNGATIKVTVFCCPTYSLILGCEGESQ
jgi:hypothetical protein